LPAREPYPLNASELDIPNPTLRERVRSPPFPEFRLNVVHCWRVDAFNERIAELENEGHRGHAMEVLKVNAIDFARRIDELRSFLVEPLPKMHPTKN
jgi:hypothetical protein